MSTRWPSANAHAAAPAVEVLRFAAFASRPGGGNPAGVVLDASTLTDAAMQQIAADVGYAETAFVVGSDSETDDRTLRVRYFSPGAEVPFCGHATVATAVALAERQGVGPFAFETPVGRIIVDTARADADVPTAQDADVSVTASFTSVEPKVREIDPEVAERLLTLLGLHRSDLDDSWPLQEVYVGNWHPIVAIRTQETFDAFHFDPASIRALMDERNWAGTVTVVWRQGFDGASVMHVEARNLFPVGDITEDPATGSAAAALGAHLRGLGAITPPAQVKVHQGRHIGRPSLLIVDVPRTGGVTVTGTAIPID
ncbi:MAG TPA: phenazine biosynthesis protein PhzF [Microbacterium sp.]|nr:phenazine biosynthesis protein PhzF [Microbacterium sp.]